MGFTKPEVPCQIFTDDDLREILVSIETEATIKGMFGVRSIIRDQAERRGIEIFNDQGEADSEDCPFLTRLT